MKSIISILISGIVISSLVYSSVDTVSTKFLPLKIGNMWTYKRYSPPPFGTTYYFKSAVTKDTVINEHIFYCLNNSEHFFPVGGGENWFRIDSTDGKLINYKVNACGNSNFYSVDSLSSSLYDLSKICPNDTLIKRKLIFINNNVWWGVQSKDLHFNWNSGPSVNRRTYSKYIGLSFSGYGEMNPISYDLMGCVINGVLYGDTNTFVGIIQISTEIPVNFELSQNYPNPFNPMTKIKFQMPKSGFAELRVFDAIGKEVDVLVNQELSPGTYEVDFPARAGRDGSNLPSGVYYYRLEVNTPRSGKSEHPSQEGIFSQTKKMVLIK